MDHERQPAAIWTSSKIRPIQLPDGRFYRVDRLEVDPERRGKKLGTFLCSVIAARALELNANGIVLGALPSAASFYTSIGGERRLCDGWETGLELQPFVFSEKTLLEFKEDIDELIEKG